MEKAMYDPPESRTDTMVEVFDSIIQKGAPVDHGLLQSCSIFLAVIAQKDMNWEKALSGENAEQVIMAFHTGRDSLLDSVLKLVTKDDPEYEQLMREAVSGRYLLDVKRSGKYKARGVKHGFKEDKATADGEGFDYYSHVVKFYTIRISFFRPNRGSREVAFLDESTAFLQSDDFPIELVKALVMWNPISRVRELFRQSGPLYGENSAPRRWEDTYAPYLESEGFERSPNEPSIFYDPDDDILDLTYVDDNYLDAEPEGIKRIHRVISSRFDCKELEVLPTNGDPVDYLGMLMSMCHEEDRTYLDMSKYIEQSLEILEWTHLKPASRPIEKQINPEGTSPLLSKQDKVKFHSGLGMLGWLSMTARPDISYAYSRLGQHQANPTEDALSALTHAWRYLAGAKGWKLSGRLNRKDRNISNSTIFKQDVPKDDQHGWEFYVDTDFAGNSELQNKRRSQVGILATLNDVPVYWKSSVSSVCFATADIGEAHADRSSGASEVMGAGNASQDFLHLSYISRDMGILFPKPFKLQMDNDAARIFAEGSCFRSKMKHIDCAQEWVKILRDKSICTPVRVDSKDNLADFFTKILDVATFRRLRSRLMYHPDLAESH